MSTPEPVILVQFLDSDVESMAIEYDIPLDVAHERVADWAQAIEDYATERVAERLASVIRTGEA